MVRRIVASVVRMMMSSTPMAAAILLLPALVQAQSTDTSSAVSIERIRAKLQQPPPVLRLPDPAVATATYHVEVRAPLFLLHPPEDKPMDPTFGLPSTSELVGRGLAKVGTTVRNYKRHRTERRARKEVDDALAAYCAAQQCPAQ
jgi:hypothetical protein